jgi:hypothetical protein
MYRSQEVYLALQYSLSMPSGIPDDEASYHTLKERCFSSSLLTNYLLSEEVWSNTADELIGAISFDD